MINSLDNIPVALDIKLKFIQSILQAKNNQGLNSEKYSNLIEEYNALFEQVNTDENILDSIEKKEKEFNTYLKDKENILENLLIYLIYKYFMETLNIKDANKAVTKIIINYVMIKALLLARYNKNNKELKEEDFVEVFYIFSRVVEHNSVFLNELYKNNLSMHQELLRQAKMVEKAEKYQNERDKIMADNRELHNQLDNIKAEYKEKEFEI